MRATDTEEMPDFFIRHAVSTASLSGTRPLVLSRIVSSPRVASPAAASSSTRRRSKGSPPPANTSDSGELSST
eukprot:CAMPEP_0115856108 /NCGR_PEP_ID=MMETSP0287-20121206/14882_1 /TAXON_ID=412157 /ORGANISM="Chrysochromulina rotalis, Strain UIO044" /LENGTH=72 /DNA_ID=CAMNT_0003310271 /DNA_START=532 /DNA_END=750 /DNA_ORIENTATION=-